METTDENGVHDAAATPQPRQLPADLPRSLDDRKSVPPPAAETEIYDAWQGASSACPAGLPAAALHRGVLRGVWPALRGVRVCVDVSESAC